MAERERRLAVPPTAAWRSPRGNQRVVPPHAKSHSHTENSSLSFYILRMWDSRWTILNNFWFKPPVFVPNPPRSEDKKHGYGRPRLCAFLSRSVYLVTTKRGARAKKHITRKPLSRFLDFRTRFVVCLFRPFEVLWNVATVASAYLSVWSRASESLWRKKGRVERQPALRRRSRAPVPAEMVLPPPPSHALSPSPSTHRTAAILPPSNHFATPTHRHVSEAAPRTWTQPRTLFSPSEVFSTFIRCQFHDMSLRYWSYSFIKLLK